MADNDNYEPIVWTKRHLEALQAWGAVLLMSALSANRHIEKSGGQGSVEIDRLIVTIEDLFALAGVIDDERVGVYYLDVEESHFAQVSQS